MDKSKKMEATGAIELARYDCDRLRYMLEAAGDENQKFKGDMCRKFDEINNATAESVETIIGICEVLVDDLRRYIDEAYTFVKSGGGNGGAE